MSEMREVDANIAWRQLGVDVPCDGWWGVPVFLVREWITEALRTGDYATASAFSALVREGESVSLVRRPVVICAAHTVGQARCAVSAANASRRDAIQRERMRLSRRRFDRGLVGDFRPARAGGPRRLLPLV